MLIGQPGDAPAPGGPGEKAHLHQVGLVDVLQGDSLLPHCGRQGLQTHGAAAVVPDDAAEHPPVHLVQTQVVHLQGGEGLVGHPLGDDPPGPDLGKVPDPAEITAALKGLDLDSLTLEEVIRQALRKMVK